MTMILNSKRLYTARGVANANPLALQLAALSDARILEFLGVILKGMNENPQRRTIYVSNLLLGLNAQEIDKLAAFLPAQRGLQKDHKPSIQELVSIFNQHDGDEDLVANDDDEDETDEDLIDNYDEESGFDGVPNPPRWLTTNQPAHRERILLRANRERAELDADEMEKGVPPPPRVMTKRD